MAMPNSLALMAFGHALGGFASAHACQPCLIEMLEVGKGKYPEWEELVSAMSAALYNSIMGISYLVAPIYGTGITKLVGFKLCMDILALADLIFFVLYMVFAGGCSGFIQTCKNLKKRSVLVESI